MFQSTTSKYEDIDGATGSKSRSVYGWLAIVVIGVLVIIGVTNTGYISQKPLTTSFIDVLSRPSEETSVKDANIPLSSDSNSMRGSPVDSLKLNDPKNTAVKKTTGDIGIQSGPENPKVTSSRKSSNPNSIGNKITFDSLEDLPPKPDESPRLSPENDPKNTAVKKTTGENDEPSGPTNPKIVSSRKSSLKTDFKAAKTEKSSSDKSKDSTTDVSSSVDTTTLTHKSEYFDFDVGTYLKDAKAANKEEKAEKAEELKNRIEGINAKQSAMKETPK